MKNGREHGHNQRGRDGWSWNVRLDSRQVCAGVDEEVGAGTEGRPLLGAMGRVNLMGMAPPRCEATFDTMNRSE
jgi:hypothetical protein